MSNNNDIKYLDADFYNEIRRIIEDSRKRIYRNMNNEMVLAYWQIGKMIIEKQGGEERAKYGDGLINELSMQMTKDFGKGFTTTNLKYMRQLYQTFPKSHALRDQLSWTHYRLILSLDDKKARDFYIKEAVENTWSTRQLEREINTFSYQRYLASNKNYEVVQDTANKEPGYNPLDAIKDPYILAFTGLGPNKSFLESELEQALIDHLREFLLELGTGFAFVARQRRFDMDGRNFYVDLVLYNYKLKCFVLIDLKRGELTHQDLGQMQMYVNYYTRELMEPGDNPPIGIVLCTSKSNTLVKYTLPLDNKQIFASKYMLCLPTEEELKQEIDKQIELLKENKEFK